MYMNNKKEVGGYSLESYEPEDTQDLKEIPKQNFMKTITYNNYNYRTQYIDNNLYYQRKKLQNLYINKTLPLIYGGLKNPLPSKTFTYFKEEKPIIYQYSNGTNYVYHSINKNQVPVAVPLMSQSNSLIKYNTLLITRHVIQPQLTIVPKIFLL